MIGQIILAVSFIINLIFLLILLKRRNESSRIFSVVISGIVVWTLVVFVWPYFNNTAILYILGLIAYWGPLATICGLYYFSFLFPKKIHKNSLLPKVIALASFIAGVVMTLIPDFVLQGVAGEGYQLETGPGLNLLFALIGCLLIGTFINFIKKFFVLKGIYREQLKFLFFGIFSTSIIGFASNAGLALFEVYDLIWLGPSSAIIMFSFTVYAITRHRLMDIRLIVARTIAFGSIVIALAAVFAAISAVIAIFFKDLSNLGSGLYSDIISGVIISILVAATYKPMVGFIEKTTNKFLFKKSYDSDELISNISDLSSSTIDIEKLLKGFYKILDEALNFEKFGVILVDTEGALNIYYKQGFAKGVAERLVSYPDVANILQKELKQNPGIQVIDEMKTRFENGEFKPVSPDLLDKLHEENIAVITPLHVKSSLTGLIILGSKKSGDPYSQEDIKTLGIIGDQVAIAIDNAKLYEELRYFNVKLEEEVEEKTRQLRKANIDLKKLDVAKSEFISIASHQLRTPLTVIKGYISMMKEGSFGPIRPKILTNLDKVYVSNERLITLVENLLDISRIESGRQEFAWKKVQLEELAAEVTEKLQDNAAKKKLKLTYHKPKTKLPPVVIDDGRLHEVMMNFVDNAIKYTAAGSVDVYVTKEKEMLTFCVKDTGKGMSEDGKNKLFKKFSRGKDSFKQHTEGLGLGLYVATMMMRAHEGKIWADSEGEGKGSSFCFSVPIKSKHKDGDISKIDEKVVEEVKAEDKKESLK